MNPGQIKWIFLGSLMALSLLFNSCKSNDMEQTSTDWGPEVEAVERAFAQMAAEKGVKEAFLHFAAEDAVISRGNQLYKGKAEMEAYFDRQTLQDVQLEWSPEHIEVSGAGDMASTYGPYTFSAVDTNGNPVTASGYFHTVWKRQPDNSWKFIWD